MKKKISEIKSKWLSISDAAKYLGVSQDTLRRWEKKGKLIPRRTVGGHRRYSRKQLENILNQPTEQIFSTTVSASQYTKSTHNTSSLPKTSNTPHIYPTSSQTKTSLLQKISKLSSNYSITLLIIVIIIILLITSFVLLQQTKTPQPSKPLTPIPSYNQLP